MFCLNDSTIIPTFLFNGVILNCIYIYVLCTVNPSSFFENKDLSGYEKSVSFALLVQWFQEMFIDF